MIPRYRLGFARNKERGTRTERTERTNVGEGLRYWPRNVCRSVRGTTVEFKMRTSMHRIRVCMLFRILASSAFFSAIGASHAQGLSGNSLEDVLYQSAKVARIRITKRIPLNTEGSAQPCGYVYSARVVQGFKGGTGAFDFVAPANEDFVDFDHDYLVVAFPHFDMTPEIDAFLRHMLSIEEDARVRCRMSTRYYVPGAHRTLWEIQEYSGEEWLAPDTRPAVAWCSAEGTEQIPGIRQVRVGDAVYDSVQWQLAKRLIERALTVRPHKPGAAAKSMSLPSSCRN